jgi:hypothetical protein
LSSGLGRDPSCNEGDEAELDWRTAGWALSVPMIRTLFSEIVNPVRLRPLGLTEVLDNTAHALDRVDRDEPPQGPRAQIPLFPELAVERDAAERVKQNVPILVVLGNPPYNAFAGTSPDEEEGLVEAYKEGLSATWRVRKYNLDDLYV